MKIKYRIIMFTTLFLLCSVILYSALHAQVSTDNPGNQLSAEEPDKVENGAYIYEHWTDFAEEWDLPYADEETFDIIKTAYAQVEFSGEFEIGNQEVYEEYKGKYKELLENDGLVFDSEAETNVPFSQLDDLDNYIEQDGLQEFVYYFFDIDGDELPELGVHIYGKGIYIIDYDSENDVYSVWYPMESYWYSLIGTKKVQWQDGRYLAFYLLDEGGKEECETFFFCRKYNEEISLCIVMLPAYAEEEKNTELTEKMKSQGIYERSDGRWYFRVTEEQYDELTKPYREASYESKEKMKEVTYTYEELFEPAYELTVEEELFLQEHLYGQWRFAERIVKIDEDNNFTYGAKPNISDVGVEELKESARILYEDTSVSFTVKIGQNSFTHAQDMYLFANHGGFNWTDNPVYCLSALEGDTITLRDVYNMHGYKISAEGMEDFIHVKYFARPDGNNSGIHGSIFTYFGSDVYIDPDDDNTIYIDFCGLWKMERDDNYYGTDGKCEY